MKQVLESAGLGEPTRIATAAARSVSQPEPIYLCSPLAFVREKLGFQPEPQQLPIFLASADRGILCCNRQFGKSTTIAALAVHRAVCFSDSLIVVIAPTLRQSNELIRKIARFLRALDIRPKADGFNSVSLTLPNHSRIVAVPANPDTLRGFSSVSMLLIDEAARVPDDVYEAATPILARSNGDIWLMSTPKGRRGFFHAIWNGDADASGHVRWTRIHATAADCLRIPRAFLEAERASKSAAEFDQEYNCVFQDASDQLFAGADLAVAFTDETHTLAPEPGLWPDTTRLHYYIGLDLGKFRDHTAISVLEFRSIATGRNPDTYEWVTESSLACRCLDRVPLMTPYDKVVERVQNLMSKEPLRSSTTTLVVDATGVGAPVLDQLRKAKLGVSLVGISITSGNAATHANGTNNVPKTSLVSNLQIMFQNRILTVSNELSQARNLRRELLEMRASSHHYGDLAMSLALAAWQARTNFRAS